MFCFSEIKITGFRNYNSTNFCFQKKIIGIYGKNGSGKTNLLDAIYYLCFTRNYFGRNEAQNSCYGTLGFRIEGIAKQGNKAHNLVAIFRENNKKEFSLDGEFYKKFSAHIGKFPCVMIAPDDSVLITGNSEERRKFIDTILSQLEKKYLKSLIDYNKLLQQRNSFLKATAERNFVDETLLGTYDTQISEAGQYIYSERKKFLTEFLQHVIEQYNLIAGKDDEVNIVYESQLEHTSFAELLNENHSRDLYLQRTGIGIHKDDLQIKMKNESFKNVASQGQRKSLLFAMKLAEFEVLKKHKGFAPVLLLDDVFEKLDEMRINNLLKKVCADEDVQVFITDTHKERLKQTLEDLCVNFELIGL